MSDMAETERDEKLEVWVTPSLKRSVRIAAAKRDESMSAFIRDVLGTSTSLDKDPDTSNGVSDESGDSESSTNAQSNGEGA